MLYSFFSIMPVFVNLFWFIVLLLEARQNNSKRFLTLFFGVMIVNYTAHWLYFNRQYELYTFIDSIWVFTSLASYPLYYWYIRTLTTDVQINWRRSRVLIPAFLTALFSAIVYLLMSPQEIDTFIHGIMYDEPGYHPPYSLLVRLQMFRLKLFQVIFVLQAILSLYFGLKLIREFHAKIKRYYSDIEGKDLNPIKWMMVLMTFASFISSASSIIEKDYFIVHPVLLAIPSITHSIFLFGVGYVGYKQKFSIQYFTQEVKENDQRIAQQTTKLIPDLSVKEMSRLNKGLQKLLKEKQIYKNPDLHLSDVALMLGTNRSYLSRVVNDEMHTSFCDLINDYRVRHAKALLEKADEEIPLEEIASMSGFNGTSSFYRIFKEKTGLTPGKYRQNCLNQKKNAMQKEATMQGS
jgi:AraC-like DNA-binding protein